MARKVRRWGAAANATRGGAAASPAAAPFEHLLPVCTPVAGDSGDVATDQASGLNRSGPPRPPCHGAHQCCRTKWVANHEVLAAHVASAIGSWLQWCYRSPPAGHSPDKAAVKLRTPYGGEQPWQGGWVFPRSTPVVKPTATTTPALSNFKPQGRVAHARTTVSREQQVSERWVAPKMQTLIFMDRMANDVLCLTI